MAQQSSFYNTDGITRTYPSSKHIASKQHVAVYFQSVTTSTWSVVESSQYEVVNNSVVFYIAPIETVYSQIEIRVADTAAELEDSPSDIAIVAGAIANVINVSNNMAVVENVNNNMGAVTTVSANITNLNSIISDVIPNLPEILLADDNAATATAKASEASTSATLAQGYAESILPSSLVKNVDAISDLATINPTTIGVDNVFVKDLDRGGLFVWSATGTANGGIVFAGLTGYWVRQYSGAVNVKWFGANTSGIKNAFDTGMSVYFPSGTYNYDLDTGGSLTLGFGASCFGDGNDSVLNISSSTLSYYNAFTVSNSFNKFSNISLVISAPFGSSGISCFSLGNITGFVVDSMSVFMGVYQTSGVQSSPNHLFVISGNASDVKITNSNFSRFKFGILKTNTATYSNMHWEITGNTFKEFYSPAVTFNTPMGDWDDVIVSNNQFVNSLAHTIGGYPHMGGVAGGASSGRFIFSNNAFSGTGQGLHFEEGVSEVVVSNNTFAITDNPIWILDNNVSGTYHTPSKFIINGNTITQTGTPIYDTVTTIGINCSFDTTKYAPVNDIVISGNIITGFTRGIQTAENGHVYKIHNNIIKNSTIGLRQSESNSSVSENTFISCATAVDNISRGGLIGNNMFIGCTAILAQSGGRGLGASSAEFMINDHSLVAGSPVPINLFPTNAKFYGQVSFHVYAYGSYRYGVYNLSYDGATLTGGASPLISGGSGTLVFTDFVVSGGFLVARFNNGSGETLVVDMKIKINGGIFA